MLGQCEMIIYNLKHIIDDIVAWVFYFFIYLFFVLETGYALNWDNFQHESNCSLLYSFCQMC